MAHHDVDLKIIEGDGTQMLRAQPETIHAGVNHQAARGIHLLPELRLRRCIDHRGEPRLQQGGDVSGGKAVQHMNSHIRKDTAHLLTLKQGGNEEICTTFPCQPAADRT